MSVTVHSKLAVGSLLVLLTTACGDEVHYPLVENYESATMSLEAATFPSFVADPAPTATVDIAGDARAALTPPFPARIRYDVLLPDAAFLEVSPALVMMQLVRRARVEFSVTVREDGESETVYSHVFRLNDANAWQDQIVDLTAWSGRSVTLVLSTHPIPARETALWADRIQTAWGAPMIVTNRKAALIAAAQRTLGVARAKAVMLATLGGVRPEDLERAFELTLNLFLGGLFSFLIQLLYVKYGTAASNREEFAQTFPMFSLVTILVITVVQASLALSLGLLGAVSIVRFRSAVKHPEDVVYLLFNVAVGVALGANQRLIALCATGVVSVFVVARQFVNRPAYDCRLLLTVAGDVDACFPEDGASILERLQRDSRPFSLERLDQDEGRVQLRAILTLESTDGTKELLEGLRRTLPGFDVNAVDMDAIRL